MVSHTFSVWFGLVRLKFGIALEMTELYGFRGQTLDSLKPEVAQTMLLSGMWMDGWMDGQDFLLSGCTRNKGLTD